MAEEGGAWRCDDVDIKRREAELDVPGDAVSVTSGAPEIIAYRVIIRRAIE